MKRSSLQRKTGLPKRGKDYARKHKAYLAYKRSKEVGLAVVVFEDGREKCCDNAQGRAEYKARREQAWIRDRGRCCLCGQFIPLEQATAEHVIPRGLGGGTRNDHIDNLAVSHFYGNQKKGSVSIERYYEMYTLAERVALCRGES